MNRRRRSPRTRQFNEREIRRRHEYFKKGMLRQEDTEGTEITHGLADCVNARSYSGFVEGRPGTLLFTGGDFGVLITDGVDANLAGAIATGSLFAASGATKAADVTPTVGQRFVVYGEGDTADNGLETAKGYAVRKFDVFKIAGAASVTYLGNLRNPAVPGFGDDPSTEYTVTLVGDTLTRVDGPNFDATLVGQYYAWYESRDRLLITEYVDNNTLKVDIGDD